MPNPYSTSTQDSPACKRLFCGRSDDLTEVLNALAQGHSVALFGERRIGKTLLLYLVRDIVSGDIAAYADTLLDGSLQASVSALQGKLTQCTPIFLSLHDLNGHDSVAFGTLLLTRLRAHGFLQPSALFTDQGQPAQPVTEPGDLPGLFATLDSTLHGRRVLLLFDEIEVLLDDTFTHATQVFRHLRSAIQTYPALTFLFAGAEDWHRRIKERTSPLVGNVKPVYLKAATAADVEHYLLGVPLRQCFPTITPTTMSVLIQQVLDWTGSKPYYVQAVSSRLATLTHVGEQWREEIIGQVHEDIAPQLANFYDTPDPVSQRILGLLAHQPGLTVPGIARHLGLSRQRVWNHVNDGVALDKVRMAGGEYHVVGSLIAEWGYRYRDLPVPSPWPRRWRWCGAGVALAAALWTYWYTHPADHVASFAFAGGSVRLTFPGSVEAAQQGTLTLAVRNTGPATLAEISVTLSSEWVDVQKDQSSRVILKALGSGEAKHLTLTYSVRAKDAPDNLPVELAVQSAERAVSAHYATTWSLRRLPLQRWWTVISSALLVLSAVLKWDVLKQLTEPLRLLLEERRNGDKNPPASANSTNTRGSAR